MGNLRGKRALIPVLFDDQASLHSALTLANHGCKVILAGEAELLHRKYHEFLENNRSNQAGDIEIVNLHIADLDSAVTAAWRLWDGLDILLISSSYTGLSTMPFLDLTRSELDDAVNINLKYVSMISIAVGRKMKDSGSGGSIIFITSIIGTERGLIPGVAIFGASIAAINYLTRAMAMELGKYKIRVNAIACGLSKSDTLLNPLSIDVVNKEAERVVPLKRWAQPTRDFSAMILYLAGDSSSFITGTVIIVDGGQSLVRPRMRSFL